MWRICRRTRRAWVWTKPAREFPGELADLVVPRDVAHERSEGPKGVLGKGPARLLRVIAKAYMPRREGRAYSGEKLSGAFEHAIARGTLVRDMARACCRHAQEKIGRINMLSISSDEFELCRA